MKKRSLSTANSAMSPFTSVYCKDEKTGTHSMVSLRQECEWGNLNKCCTFEPWSLENILPRTALRAPSNTSHRPWETSMTHASMLVFIVKISNYHNFLYGIWQNLKDITNTQFWFNANIPQPTFKTTLLKNWESTLEIHRHICKILFCWCGVYLFWIRNATLKW